MGECVLRAPSLREVLAGAGGEEPLEDEAVAGGVAVVRAAVEVVTILVTIVVATGVVAVGCEYVGVAVVDVAGPGNGASFLGICGDSAGGRVMLLLSSPRPDASSSWDRYRGQLKKKK